MTATSHRHGEARSASETPSPSPDSSPDDPRDRPQRPAPREDHRRFRRDQTPIWLATAALLAGERAPDLTSPFTVVYLGADAGVTAAVAAAVHPRAQVWVWDPRSRAAEAICRLAGDASLDNLHVHRSPRPPAPSDTGTADMVVIDRLFDALSDDHRDRLVQFTAEATGPGGLVAVTYRTTVGWSEVAPLVHLARYLVHTSHRDPRIAVSDVRRLLDGLRGAGARYLQRRVVSEWVDHLLDEPEGITLAQLMEVDLRPLSLDAFNRFLEPAGFHYLTNLAPGRRSPELPGTTEAHLSAAGSTALHESLYNLAVCPDHRTDLFRLGSSMTAERELTRHLGDLLLTGITPTGPDPASAAETSLTRQVVSLSELAGGTARFRPLVELAGSLFETGQAHPVLVRPDTKECTEAAASVARLNRALATQPGPSDQLVMAASAIASAVNARPRPSAANRRRLGIA